MISIKKIIFLGSLISLASFAHTETWYTKGPYSQGNLEYEEEYLAFPQGHLKDVDVFRTFFTVENMKTFIQDSIRGFIPLDTAALRIGRRIQQLCIENHQPLRRDIAQMINGDRSEYFTFIPDLQETQSAYLHIMAPGLCAGISTWGEALQVNTPSTLNRIINPYLRYCTEKGRKRVVRFHRRSHCVGITIINLSGFTRAQLMDPETGFGLGWQEYDILALKDSQYQIYVYDDMPDNESPLTAECHANFRELQRLVGSRQIHLISGDENACAEQIFKQDEAEMRREIKKHGAVRYLKNRAIHGPSIPSHASQMHSARRNSTREPMAGAGAGRGSAPRSQSPRSRARIAATTELDSLFPPIPDWQSPFEAETLAERRQREALEQRQAMRDARIKRLAKK